MNEFKHKILDLLKEDARHSPKLIATMLGVNGGSRLQQAIAEMENDHIILKYATVVNWSKVDEEKVTSLIEVQITPERGRGFDAIAERIYLFPEVKSVYLMSGGYDLLVEIEGRSLREVASFVSSKLSTTRIGISDENSFYI